MTSPRSMAGWNMISLVFGFVVLLCAASEARIVNLGQESSKSNFGCDACLQFSNEAQMILSDPETRERAVELISQMACQTLTTKLKEKCSELVNAYVPDALTALQAYLGPEICTEAGLCPPEGQVQGPESRVRSLMPIAETRTCALCQDFAEDALKYLESNVTKSKIIGALHLACSKLDDLSRQCDLLVDVYAPDLIEQIVDLTPKGLCEIPHLCQPSAKPDEGAKCAITGVTRNDCAICQFVVLELKIKLRDPAVQARILDVLLNGCDRVQNHVDECKLIVGQYAPFILANLDTLLDADTVCTKLRACPGQMVEDVTPVLSLYSGRRSHHNHDHLHRRGHKQLVHAH